MSREYSDPKRAADPYALPDLEVFFADTGELRIEGLDGASPAGHWYWYCFPGCLPDSEPYGPFATYEEALADARNDAEGFFEEEE